MLIQFDEYRLLANNLTPIVLELGSALNIEKMRSTVSALKEESSNPDFYSDMEKSQQVLKQIKQLDDKIAKYDKLCSRIDDLKALISLAIEEDEESLLDEIVSEYNDISEAVENSRLETLLSGPYDKSNAIMTFHAGAGGTEAQDWAQMLYRMYTMWAQRRGFTYKILDYIEGDEAGLKSADILIEGENVFGYLKGEMGVHRLVRISPFDSSGRRHTSFVAIEVMPEIDDSMQVDIKEDDLKVDTYRSGGAGGQHVNKTESAIRITHIPTGIVVACQNERSQHQNRELAMRMLKSKLIEIKEREHLSKIEDIKGEQKKIEWGSQIRSYVFMPYTLVKDHRTNFEMGNIDAVMDGELDGFINACLKHFSEKNK